VGLRDRTLFLSTLAPAEEMIRKLNEFQPMSSGAILP